MKDEFMCLDKQHTKPPPDIQLKIDKGFIDADCKPIKCEVCGGDDFKQVNNDYEDGCLMGYDFKCTCGEIVGRWYVGYWGWN